MGIIWNKTPSVLMEYLVVIFSHLKKTTGCFIHNDRLDLNCVKFTCGTKKKQEVGIIWNKAPLVLMNYLVVIFSHLKKPLVVLSITRRVGFKLCKIHLWYKKKQEVGIIWNKAPLVLMNYLMVIFSHLKKPLVVLSISLVWI